MTKQTFNERVQSRLKEAIQPLLEDTPEVDGIGIAIAWRPDVGTPHPPCLIFGVNSAEGACRMGSAASKLCDVISARVGQLFAQADEELRRLKGQIDAYKRLAETSTPTPGGADSAANTGGIADPFTA
jgi:hypothetical protein